MLCARMSAHATEASERTGLALMPWSDFDPRHVRAPDLIITQAHISRSGAKSPQTAGLDCATTRKHTETAVETVGFGVSQLSWHSHVQCSRCSREDSKCDPC